MEQTVREQCVYYEKTVGGKNCSLTLSPIDWNAFGEYGTNSMGTMC